ncbi:MAG: Lrp/AsnC family transcriptional regulator [Promethearchaeota archaeon]
MDAIDIQILEELKRDSRKSFNVIAEGVGKTEATVRRRVNKLIEDNVIKKFTIDFSVNTKPKTRATVKIEPDFRVEIAGYSSRLRLSRLKNLIP